jgi:hypothetical protein
LKTPAGFSDIDFIKGFFSRMYYLHLQKYLCAGILSTQSCASPVVSELSRLMLFKSPSGFNMNNPR